MTTSTNPSFSVPYQQSAIDPETPSFGLNFSSPDTPSLNLETPVHSQSSGKRLSVGSGMDIDHPSEDADDGVGLGYGDVHSRAKDKGKGKVMGRDEAIVTSALDLSAETTPVLPLSGQNEDVEDDGGIERTFPDDEELKRMATRLEELEGTANAESASGESSELIEMVRSLLTPTMEQLPFVRRQIEAQRQTISTLQRQARLSEELMKVERERHLVEREGWRSETRAMLKVREAEIASGVRPRKVLDLNVGYHQELEAANKRLEMDNRLMAPRLADASQQVDRLVNELRHLRPYVIIETAPTVQPVHPPDPDQPRMYPAESSDRRKSSSPFKRTGQTTMGDARTELLLLAAKKLRTLRDRDDETGLVTLNEMKRGGVIGPDGGVGYVEGYGGLMLEPEDAEDEMSDSSEDERPVAPVPRGKRAGATPSIPQSKGPKRGTAPPATPRGKNRRGSATTPGGSNFNDLLRAAELATRPGSPTPARAGPSSRPANRKRADSTGERATSPKRSRREAPATDWIPRRGIRSRNARRGLRSQSRDEGYDDSPDDAGLDLLLQASQMDVQQNPGAATAPLPSASRFEGMIEGPKNPSRTDGQGSSLAPAIDLRAEAGTSTEITLDDQIDPSLVEYDATATPQVRRPSDAGQVHTPARRNPPTYLESGGGFYDAEEDDDFDDPMQSGRHASVMDVPPGAYASPTGATVPGLGKYVHLTSNVPARRMRSPYLKWTVEEDELLARAVALHGEKWDLVSKGVPTRSYHQVRQRWLRKTGAFDKKGGDQGPPAHDDTSPSPGNKGGKKKK